MVRRVPRLPRSRDESTVRDDEQEPRVQCEHNPGNKENIESVQKSRTNFLIFLIPLYGLFITFFTPFCSYNSAFVAFSFSPLIPGMEREDVRFTG